MADVIGEALFDIKAGTAGFLSDISGAVGKADGMFSNMGNNMSSKMQGVGGIMTAGLTAPILAIGAFALESAKTVDGAMNTMIRKTGESGTSADKLKESFKNVFGNTSADAATVSDVMSTLHNRLNVTGTDLENLSLKTINLAKLTGGDATSIAESTAKIGGAWHLTGADVGAVQDQLYSVYTKTGVSVEDLSGAMAKSGALMTTAKVPMMNVEASLGAMGAAGIPAKQGVSIVTDAVTKLQKETGKQDVGKEYSAMMERLATGTGTAADKALLGEKNFDKLNGSLGDGQHGYDALLKSMSNADGSINKQAESTMTFSEKLSKFKNDLMLAFEPLGKVLINVFSNVLSAVQPLLPVITGIFEFFSHMPAPVQLIVVAILGILAAIGPILMILPALVAGFSIVAGIVGMISLPIILILAAVILVAAAVYLLYTRFKPFHDAVDEVLGWIQTLFGDLMSGDFGKFGDDFKNGILAGFNALLSFNWGGLLNTIVSALSGLGHAILNFILNIDWGALGNAIWTAIKSWLNPKFLKLLTDQLVTIGSFIFDKIKTGLAGLGNWFKTLLQDFGQWVWNGLITYFNFMTKLREQFVSLLTGFGQWVWDGLITYFNFMTKLRTEFVNLLLGFGSWVWGGIGTLWEDLKSAFKGVADYFGGLINGILNVADQRAQNSPMVAQQTGTAPPESKVYDAGPGPGVVAGNKADWWNYDVGGALGRATSWFAASGAIVRSRTGGVPVVVGEGGEDEYIIPESKMGDFGAIAAMPQMAGGGIISGGMVSSFGGSAKNAQAGNTVFNVAFNNATLTSVDEADKLGRRMAYAANEYLRRSGHSRG